MQEAVARENSKQSMKCKIEAIATGEDINTRQALGLPLVLIYSSSGAILKYFYSIM